MELGPLLGFLLKKICVLMICQILVKNLEIFQKFVLKIKELNYFIFLDLLTSHLSPLLFLKNYLNSVQNLHTEKINLVINFQLKPFLANVLILYPLKTPENRWFFGVFRGYKMGTLARNGLNKFVSTQDLDLIVRDNSILSYYCADPSFIDKDHGNY